MAFPMKIACRKYSKMGGKASKGHGRRESRTPSQSQSSSKEDKNAAPSSSTPTTSPTPTPNTTPTPTVHSPQSTATQGDLFAAAEKGKIEELKSMLQSKADVNSKNKSGATALHHATAAGQKDAVELLLEAGASVEAIDGSKCSPLYYGVIRGNQEIVKLLLEKRASLVAGAGEDGSMLFTAIKNGHYEMVSFLLDAKADIDVPNPAGESPLETAMEQESGEPEGKSIVNLLLERKAVPTTKSGGDPNVLMKAALSGNEDMVSRCAHNFSMGDINAQDRRGKTALLYAADQGHINIVRLLCEAKADAQQEDNEGETPLIAAARHGYTDVIRVLMSTGQADPLHRTSAGQTAVSVARTERQPEALKLLSSREADVESLDVLKKAIKDEGGEFSKRGTAKFVKDYGAGAGGFTAFYNS
jgi:serine/threonine-protein phosphatase 6 regulatory ankyrin repeat subunit B